MRLRSLGRKPTVCFDLENRPSAYWYDGQTTSEITAFGWKWDNQPEPRSMLLLRDGRFLTDTGRKVTVGRAYRMFVDELSAASVVYGHNIRRHDLPMLNSGLQRLQQPMLPVLLTCDTLRDGPKRNGMAASLAAYAAMYDLGGHKLAMSQPEWEQANRLEPAGIDLARERVESDVMLQEKLRLKMLDLGLLRPPQWWRP